jgi:multidrug resistance efflux pump
VYARVVSLALVVALTAGCAASSPGPIAVTGTVGDDLLTVATPSIGAVAPNPNAGFSPVPLTPKATPDPAPLRVAWAVAEGTRVQPGDVLVRTDAGALDAALVMAQADAGRARAQVDLLASNVTDLDTKTSDLRTKRQTISDGLVTLAQKRSDLVKTRKTLTSQRPAVAQAVADLTAQRKVLVATIADLTTKRTTLVASIADLQAQLAAATAASSPAVPQLQAALSDAQAGLTKLNAGLAQTQAGLTQLDAGLAKATSGLAQIDRGLAQIATGVATIDQKTHEARDGLAAVDDGLSQLGDARTQLVNARDLATIAIAGSDVAVEKAQQQRDLATIKATSAGVVVSTPRAGDVVLAGTPLVRIREDQPATVTAWLAPDDAARLCTGDPVRITSDAGIEFDGTLTRISTEVAYPPSSVATDRTHMTRTVAITVTTSGTLPPGWPVDLRLTPCRPV